MKLFEPCYDMALRWARHRHATKYLGGLSFSESVFFPIPPDVMLAPMALSQPEKHGALHLSQRLRRYSAVSRDTGWAILLSMQ